jgi:hypothetical protein
MINNLYGLSWRSDGDVLYYFEGPPGLTQEQFKKICDELLPLAADVALKNAEKEEDYLGWHKIVEALSDLLPAKGFKRIDLTAAVYDGDPFIDKENVEKLPVEAGAKSRIVAHNDRMDSIYLPKADAYEGLGFEEVDTEEEDDEDDGTF